MNPDLQSWDPGRMDGKNYGKELAELAPRIGKASVLDIGNLDVTGTPGGSAHLKLVAIIKN